MPTAKIRQASRIASASTVPRGNQIVERLRDTLAGTPNVYVRSLSPRDPAEWRRS